MAINDTPFNNPTAHPELVEMWRNNLRKSQQRIPPPSVLAATVLICFGGGSYALLGGEATMAVVTFPCRILSATLLAGDSALNPVPFTATVDVRLGALGNWSSGSTPLHGGTMPAMASVPEKLIDIADWITELQPGDLLPSRIVSCSGVASWLILCLWVRRLDVVGIDVGTVTDTGGAAFTDSGGNPYVIRSR